MMKNKRAFTIVELVIVIAVVAILASVLIPTFSGIIKKAEASRDLQHARNSVMSFIVETNVTSFENTVVVVDGDKDGVAENRYLYKSGSLEKDTDADIKLEGYEAFVVYMSDTSVSTSEAEDSTELHVEEDAIAVIENFTGMSFSSQVESGDGDMIINTEEDKAARIVTSEDIQEGVYIFAKEYRTEDIDPEATPEEDEEELPEIEIENPPELITIHIYLGDEDTGRTVTFSNSNPEDKTFFVSYNLKTYYLMIDNIYLNDDYYSQFIENNRILVNIKKEYLKTVMTETLNIYFVTEMIQ